MQITLTRETLDKFLDNPWDLNNNAKPLAERKAALLQAKGKLCCTFKNGNTILEYENGGHAIWDCFTVVSPLGEVLNVFRMNEPRNHYYIDKIDTYVIPGSDSIGLVFNDGELDEMQIR